MVLEFFKKTAKKVNGKLYYSNSNVSIEDYISSPYVVYKLHFEYKSNKIKIMNNTGTVGVGNFSCTLSKTLQPVEFEIDYISHFKNLFLRKKNRIEIKSKNESIVKFLENNEAFKLLIEISKHDKFDPYIACKFENSSWNIITKYHLEFANWTQVIEPIIELYKNLIDEFDNE